ncbi:hypothetical protein [Halonatronum saccharophilum]|uniref:hypothetical protein n=1 Tax=Halonatronum saccharophilum TaxID=150060 RepID=UPI00048715AD|nr:hypothetical protein [Halonatronum saccharophilum]
MISKGSLKVVELEEEMIKAVAKKMGIPTIKLENNLLQLGYGRYRRILDGVISDNVSHLGVNISLDQDFTRSFLKGLGLKVHDKEDKSEEGDIYRFLVIGERVLRAKNITTRKSLSLDSVDKSYKDLAVKAVGSLGLEVGEVYLYSYTLDGPIREGEGVIKLDSKPLLDNKGLIKKFIRFLSVDRIPIVTLAGGKDDIIILEILKKICEEFGLQAGVNDSYEDKERKGLLRNENLEVALFLEEAEGLLREGFGYEGIDIGIVGPSFNKVLEDNQPSQVKGLLKDNILDGGYLILESSDPYLFNLLKDNNDFNIIISSLEENDIIIRKQISQNKAAVYLRDRNIILFDEEEELPIISLDELEGQLTEKLLRKIMLIIAVSFAHHIPIFILRSVLLEFFRI